MWSLQIPLLRTTSKSMLCHHKSIKPLLYLEKKLQGHFGWEIAAAAFRITLDCFCIQQGAWIPHHNPPPPFCAIYSLYIIYLQTPTLSPSHVTLSLPSFLHPFSILALYFFSLLHLKEILCILQKVWELELAERMTICPLH